MKRILILLSVCSVLQATAQQSSMPAVLDAINANNLRIRATAQETEAQRLQARTGLSLPDPTVDFDYMTGTPTATAGTQNDLTIAQGFDFPTAYGARRKVAEIRSGQQEQVSIATRREVLLDAQRTCIALVHANKRARLLAERHEAAVRFRDGVRQRFDREAATILDRNKAELLEAGIAADAQRAEMERLALLQHLAELNGGEELAFTDTAYAPVSELPDFSTYEAEMEAADPDLRMLQAEVEASEAQTKAYKASGLPGFEVGYRYQGILGANYHGVHAGLNVPLWSNRFKVKQQQQWTTAYTLRTDEHKLEHLYEARHLYDRAVAMRTSLLDFQQRLGGANSTDLLEKSFEAGQMSTLEYQMELLLLKESTDRWLQLEREYQEAMAEVFKYKL
ncbi:MAG: TolC family protein [Flavobacteriales bacterium]|nr:TolC family protein [Flavobacteriales bacterium]